MHSNALHECACHSAAHQSPKQERRIWSVVALSAAVMVVEVVVGTLTGSLALTVDGFHMATHVAALGLAAVAYWYGRTRSTRGLLTFGPAKVYALAGYTNAVVLGLAGAGMFIEAVLRVLHPAPVAFMQALPIAALGLVVNLASAVLLGGEEPDVLGRESHEHDHNARAALAHVLADALTSVFAIVALVAGHWLGWTALDAISGAAGGIVIVKWALDLARDSVRHLLDVTPSFEAATEVRKRLEAIDDVHVADLHLWDVAPGLSTCMTTLVTSTPRDTAVYRDAILAVTPVTHLTVEVRRCPGEH